jgi:hypothetical protein
MRRFWALRKREASKNVWPIDRAAGETPPNWPGWPEKKQFALVLTHDVEGPEGESKCRQLAELEMELGFRSSFNFVPEGTYQVPRALRDWLTENGFEVGVHDLNHDGKLFRDRKNFAVKAIRINKYIKDWGASGFRAGFMHNNLDWQHDIKCGYDASTFDTDPFEPHPTGAGTIFPYWVQGRGNEGYVELPYTLAQDSTLFLILREESNAIWRTKVDWVATHGGMALMNTHPDYMNFNNAHTHSAFPIGFYRDFLQYVKSHYEGQYWHALPREVSAYASQHRNSLMQKRTSSSSTISGTSGVKIWIDLENTPHIPFFNPIIKELKKRGHTVVLTARDAYQTCEMADLYGFQYEKIGHHYGKKMFMKAFGLGIRVLQLISFVRREKPALGLNHGARAQTIICNLFKIPSVLIMDYEYSSGSSLVTSPWKIFPEVVAKGRSGHAKEGEPLSYSGIKEDVYVAELIPDSAILTQLHLEDSKIIITVRPPATEAHYHNPEAEILFTEFMNRAINFEGTKVVLLPRNKRQEAAIRAQSPQWFQNSKVIIPDTVVDGMNLLWHSDLVVSGGGTMNREAAALGVPVYSIFRGTIGAVDHYLQENGRLILVESVEDVHKKILIASRPKTAAVKIAPRKALSDIVNHIEDIIKREHCS